MINFKPALIACAIALCTGLLRGQSPAVGADQGGQIEAKFPYFRIELPGGTYTVRLDAIASISTQKYILDGTARVTELNISTPGIMQPRFYYIEPLPVGPGTRGQELLDRAQSGADQVSRRLNPDDSESLGTRVVKSYPTTTHAGTIEYRLASLEELEQLHQSIEEAWLTRTAASVSAGENSGNEGGQDDQ